MIIKIKSHKRPSFNRVLEYMINNKDRLFDNKGNSFVITHNLKGNNIKSWVKQYEQNEQYRLRSRKDSVKLTHEILSWHNKDRENITLAKMEKMAREYIKHRNQKGIYVAIPHFDKDHFHVHICSSGIEYKTGKSLRLSKQELQKLKKGIQQYQIEQFPELSNSIVKHGVKNKQRLSEKEYQAKLRTGRATNKEEILKTLNDCFKQAKNKESFFGLIKKVGLETYNRNGQVTGVLHNNYKFRFNRLGFNEKNFDELSKVSKREQEIGTTRDKSKDRGINRNR
ncbi:MAG: hypothetical protein EYC69_12080 [Bacteroidetes bacterium]|nr:MAG: hypothetical protein EYC69_12080 [Bacteroidota bacterium]